MTDIAALGLSVDSSQVDKGTASLTKLTSAAKGAQVAATGLAGGNKTAAASANAAAAALNTEAASAAKAAAAMRTHATAVNDNARRMGGSMSGLAAQFQDIGVTASMGMNPAIIALQQGTQIAGQMEMAMQGGASATSVLGTAFKSLFSPMTFITIALTAIAAGVFQMVDWASAGAAALDALASVLETIAPYAAMAAAGLALLYAPAIIGGIVQVIALMGRLAVSAVTAAAAMAAANPAAAFVLGITAAVAAANIFRDELARIFGIDIVGAAKNGVNTVIGAFVGGYNGIVAAWGQLPAALGDIAIQTANRVLDAIQQMVRSAVTMINSVIAGANGKLRGLGVDFHLPMLDNKIGRPQIDNPFAGSAAGVGSTIADAIRSAQGTDYLGEFGSAISNAASGAADKLRELAGSFGSVEEAAGKAGRAGKGAADKAKDAWVAAQKEIEQVKNAFQDAGRGAGGILKGLIDGTLSWRDALSQAVSVAFKLMQSINPNFLGGGFFQGLLGGLLGFANGGYTGNGPASSVAGVVHGKEYVFSAAATAKIGKGNLDALHNAARGYANGGYVTPAMPRPANDQPIRIELVSRFDADGGFDSAVERSSRPVAIQESAKAAGQVARAVPSMALGAMDAQRTRRTRTIYPGGAI